MIQRVSEYFTTEMVKSGVLAREDIEYVQFGLNLILRKLIHILIFLGTALAFDKIFEGIIFLIFFSFLRENCGGYHFSTRNKCYVFSGVISLLFLLNVTFFSFSTNICRIAILLLSIFLIIFNNAGYYSIDFSEIKIKMLNRRGRILTLLTAGIYIIFDLLKMEAGYYSIFMSVFVVSMLLFLDIFKKFVGGRY
ncbi:hypothetical protein GCV60_15165 [Listeria monocytogenes]|nr:hypothetical protein [Listeria monocytogenes]